MRLGKLDRLLRCFDRIAADGGITQLALGRRGELEQLVVGGRGKATLEIGDRLQSLLDALELARPGVDRRDEAMEIGADLAEPHRQIAELLDTRAELGREALERRERTLGSRGERGRAVALVGSDRRGGGVRRFRELLDMPQSLASSRAARPRPPGAIPSVASTSACSSASRNATASASRVNSS